MSDRHKQDSFPEWIGFTRLIHAVYGYTSSKRQTQSVKMHLFFKKYDWRIERLLCRECGLRKRSVALLRTQSSGRIACHLSGWHKTAALQNSRKNIGIKPVHEFYVLLNVWCSVLFRTGAAIKWKLNNGVGRACNTLGRRKMHTKVWTENVK
jgi:hypothetical protein